jgi:hypothetical protein
MGLGINRPFYEAIYNGRLPAMMPLKNSQFYRIYLIDGTEKDSPLSVLLDIYLKYILLNLVTTR